MELTMSQRTVSGYIGLSSLALGLSLCGAAAQAQNAEVGSKPSMTRIPDRPYKTADAASDDRALRQRICDNQCGITFDSCVVAQGNDFINQVCRPQAAQCHARCRQ